MAKGERLNLKHFRIPINFINQTIAPVFLKECAQDGRSWGKYIAFTDSRQGTAISAKTFNIDVEWTQVRERTLKRLSESSFSQPKIDLNGIPEQFHAQILAQLKQNTPNGISLEQLADAIYDERIFHHITSTDGSPDKRAYRAALMRQYIGRRPRYVKNMESMGLIKLVYSNLKDLKMPGILADYASQEGIDIKDQDWIDYLYSLLDFWVRAENHIQPLISGERRYVRDSSLSKPIAGPDDLRERAAHWPSVKINEDGKVSHAQHRMVVLLCAGLQIYTLEQLQNKVRFVDALIREAWQTLTEKRVLKEILPDDTDGYNNAIYYPDGRFVGCYYLDLSGEEGNTTARIAVMDKGVICPVSRSILNTTFCGYSPLIVGELSEKLCERYFCTDTINMPTRPRENEVIEDWMANNKEIKNLHKLGLWSNRYKYTYKWKPAYLAAEHSAQQ